MAARASRRVSCADATPAAIATAVPPREPPVGTAPADGPASPPRRGTPAPRRRARRRLLRQSGRPDARKRPDRGSAESSRQSAHVLPRAPRRATRRATSRRRGRCPGLAQRAADTFKHGARRLRERRLVQRRANLRGRPARQGDARGRHPVAVRRPAVDRQARPPTGRADRGHLDSHLGEAPRLVQPQLAPPHVGRVVHRENDGRASRRTPPRPRAPAAASPPGRDRRSGRPA